MYGHIYIRHNGVTVIHKTNDSEAIYWTLIDMGCSEEDAIDIASWAENAPIGEEYETGDPQTEIDIGE